MLIRLILLFTLVPTLEMYVLLVMAGTLGILETLLLCVLTGVVGAHLARREGLSVLGRVQGELKEGRLPGGAMVEGALVFAGGLLLLTPGVMTDLLGFSLVLPPTRAALARAIQQRFRAALEDGSAVRFSVLRPGTGGFAGGAGFSGAWQEGPAGETGAWHEGPPGGPDDDERKDDDPYRGDPRIRRITE